MGRTGTGPSEAEEQERHGTRRPTPESRSALVTVTSVVLYAVGSLVATAGFGLLGVGGVLLLGTMFGVVISSGFLTRLPLLGSFVGLGVDWLLGIGALLAIVGVLELSAGERLWQGQRSGGILGVVAVALSIVASVLFLALRPTGEVVGVAGIIVALALLGLLSVVWRRLR